MVDIVVSVAAKVAEYLVAPVGRQCGYVIFSNRYVGELRKELENLDDARVGLQRSVDDALNNMRDIKCEVNRWKNNAETVADKARGLLDMDVRAKKTCFCRWLPNPKEHYCLGRDARKTIQAIQALVPQGKFEKVYYESDPPGRVAGASVVNSSAADGGNTIADSRASIIQGIMEALDDEKLKVIGVYGPGGAGKTTLLKQVKETLKKKGRPFDMIVTAEVSQTPDLINIQGQIADALSLNLKDKETQQGRRDHLLQRLQSNPEEKVLIILDDLWKELNLEAVGIPLGDVSGKCKLLLTSRFKDVLEQKMFADRTFFLESLNNDEAFRLFEKTVGDRLKDDKELKAIAAQVVNKLAGLPLLIISVAKTLKNSSASAWRNALIKLDEPNAETIVKLSYNHLKSKDAKSLFLLCGLIGGTIQVETLLVLGMGLGLFEEFDEKIQGARDKLNTLLDSLRSICLLQNGGNNKKNVTIHDLYSEVVVSTPFEGQNSLMMNNNYRPRTKEKLEKCWAICLVDVGSDRLAELTRCAFPELKILMLSQPKNWKGRPAHRHGEGDCCRLNFTYMKGPRVLYLCSMYIPTLPSSIEILRNLWSLYLDHCDVGDVAILGKLKALRILSFAGSKISRLPKEIGHLTNLRSLNLSKCEELEIIEPGALKRLIKLEELHMMQSFNQWTHKDEMQSESCNAWLGELKSLTKLTSLEISINDPTILLEDDDLPFGNLITFWINIGNAKRTSGMQYEGLSTMKLKLEGCDSILSRECIKKTLQNTQDLHLNGMREFKNNAHELCARGFPQLKRLNIEDSPSIKYIANSSDGAFPNLESLSLSNLINLEKICHDFVGSRSFSKLKIVRVSECGQLKYLWCLSQMQKLVRLEEIYVSECNSMRAISTDGAGKDVGSICSMVELPNVRFLELVDLPNMTSFCTTTEITSEDAPLQVTFPNITTLKIGAVKCKKLWNNQIPNDSFCKLESLELNHCDNLQRITPSHMWKRLQCCLENLEVISRRSIEIIYEGDGMDTEGGKLTTLVLRDLEKLRHIWQCNDLPNVPFPNLRDVEVVRCSHLEMLFPTFTAKFLGQIEDLMVESCEDMKQIAGHEKAEEAVGMTITFSKLIALRLFESFLPMKYPAVFPSSDVSSGTEPNQGSQ
ncbi:hypothetical protein BT93_G0136 [Corymbia citriodora subsp. variegata]|nr:hypothetical protein BT93_G0136 [Corymbia citriodora subsp. variegata]